MAIGKITKGSKACGLMDYLLGPLDNLGKPRPRVKIIGGTLGFDPEMLKEQFASLSKLRPNLKKNVLHGSIALAPEDASISDDTFAEIGDLWAEGMGFEGYTIVCHGDHIHIAASRINLDGSVVCDSHDFRRSEGLIRGIETQFGLMATEPSHLLQPNNAAHHVAAPTQAELEMAQKDVLSAKGHLQGQLATLTSQPITATDFVAVLETLGIDVRPHFDDTGDTLLGFSFGHAGRVFSASILGRSFSIRHLEPKGFSYVKERDFRALSAARDRSIASAATDRPDREHTSEPRPAESTWGASHPYPGGPTAADHSYRSAGRREQTDQNGPLGATGRVGAAKGRIEGHPRTPERSRAPSDCAPCSNRKLAGSQSSDRTNRVLEAPLQQVDVSGQTHTDKIEDNANKTTESNVDAKHLSEAETLTRENRSKIQTGPPERIDSKNAGESDFLFPPPEEPWQPMTEFPEVHQGPAAKHKKSKQVWERPDLSELRTLLSKKRGLNKES
ncbi:relaxase/mobilization nuclease domain-containing protein [Donghicola sp. C2-DW-16]|uniref:Relaxase/mobilization nuclease domain-containing protein n=1 Tax=Donghicola mangrovi TaxID=2729614 RepID=A0ABX2PDN1_9RHOB|nr:relaxase/mobilization nuclease domain-containing protein [Donghicola mangrovi]NVO27583.1 relaxase/mobilization nuclease domain-containing protein [Donghicola mangrovi]